MATSAVFDRVADLLEEQSGLSRLEARGTLRLALKQAGLDPQSLTPRRAAVVAERLLPSALEIRGIADAAEIGRALAEAIHEMRPDPDGEGPDTLADVFRRIGSR